MKNLLLFTVLIISFLGKAWGQVFNFDHLNITEGLSNNAVLCSTQDKNGFLWFGTKDGLNRFDGYTFKKYFSDIEARNGLTSNYITCLLVDQYNVLWVGTDNGLYKFHANSETFKIVPGTEMKEIIEMQHDGKDNLWFLSSYKLFKLNSKALELKAEPLFPDTYVTALTKNSKNEVWAASHQGLLSVDGKNRIEFKVNQEKSLNVESIAFENDDKIWIGTQHNGLISLDMKSKKFDLVIPFVKNGTRLFVRDIKKINENELWIASESGLVVIDTRTNDWRVFCHERDNPWSLSDNAAYSILKDHQGGIWIGTYFGGLNYFHHKHNLFERTFPMENPNSISGNAVREIRQDKNGNLWIGTEDNGLNFWDKRNNTFLHFSTKNGLSHNNIHGLEIVGDSLLVGTFNNGLDIININSKKIIAHYTQKNTHSELGSNFVMSTYKTKDGRVFFTTPNGLYQFFPGKDRFKVVEAVPDSIFFTSMLEDRMGRIWLTTWRDGVYLIDPDLKNSQVFKHDWDNQSSINSNRTNRIQQDSEGKIWIATENGLTICSEDNKIVKRFTKSDGLPSNLILSMQEDSNKNMWLSSTNGLISIDINTYVLSVYNKEFGLSNLQFNYNSMFKDQEGNMYFGSTNGLIKFHPDSLLRERNSETKVPIYFTFARSSKRNLEVNYEYAEKFTKLSYDKVSLDYDESTVQIDFAALNYVDAASTSYLYKLKGFDNDWVVSKENRAYYTKLPSGEYTLLVKALDSQGRIISDEISIPIEVNKPFWASGLAFAVYAIILILIVFFVYQYFDNQIKERNRRQLMEINANRERRLYQAKLDFFTQVAHDIKTPLTLIKGPLEKLVDNKNLAEDRTDRLLTTMQKNTEKLVRLTNSILDFRKIETDEKQINLTVCNISEFITEFINDYQASFQLEGIVLTQHIQQGVKGKIDEDMISKIVENLFSNALKYADKMVDVQLIDDDKLNYWILELKNDGHVLNRREVDLLFKPFHRSNKHSQIEGSGLGLALAHSFALLHSGDLRYVENSENLNIFVLAIPKNL